MAGFLAKSAKQLVSEFKRQSQGQSLPTSFTKCWDVEKGSQSFEYDGQQRRPHRNFGLKVLWLADVCVILAEISYPIKKIRQTIQHSSILMTEDPVFRILEENWHSPIQMSFCHVGLAELRSTTAYSGILGIIKFEGPRSKIKRDNDSYVIFPPNLRTRAKGFPLSSSFYRKKESTLCMVHPLICRLWCLDKPWSY